jgi:signal transduction histidine kinase
VSEPIPGRTLRNRPSSTMPADHELAAPVVTIETSGRRGPSRPMRSAIRRLWVICGLLVGSAFLIGGEVIWREHQNAYAAAERELSNLGVVLAEQTSRTVQSVDVIVQAVQLRVSSLDIQSPAEFRERLAGDTTHQFLLNSLRNLPQADAIALIDSSGTLLSWSREQPTNSLDLSDRDYFVWLRDHDGPVAFVGLPSKGRATGNHMMFVARRIDNQRGQFLGVVLGLISTRFLEDFYSTISMVPGESVTLLHREGVVFAGHPDIENRRGKHMPQQSLWYDRVAQGGGSYLSPGYLTDFAQIITVSPLHDYPLVVDVNMSEDAALRDWHQETIGIAVYTMIVALGLAVLFGVIVALFRRQEVQHAKLGAFAEMSSDWFWEQDAEFRFVRDPTLTLAGLPSDAGKTRWDVADPAMNEERWNSHRADLGARKPFRNFRWERILPDGSRHYLSSSGEPVFDEKGAFTGYRGTGRDTTMDVESANELRMARDRAEAANHAKSEFLANTGHELRTPLHAIIGFSELIQKQPGGRNDRHAEWSGEILGSARQLLQLINNVLELSALEAGRYELANDRIALATFMRACCSRIREQTSAAGVRVDCAVGDHVLVADQQAVRQIILNLLSNAVRFTLPDGSVSIRTEHALSGALAIIIADTGIGMDSAALAMIGQPFVQADASKSRKYEGAGLGLAICRKLIALHGGELIINSSPGNGTTAKVVFPASRVAKNEPRSHPLLKPIGEIVSLPVRT